MFVSKASKSSIRKRFRFLSSFKTREWLVVASCDPASSCADCRGQKILNFPVFCRPQNSFALTCAILLHAGVQESPFLLLHPCSGIAHLSTQGKKRAKKFEMQCQRESASESTNYKATEVCRVGRPNNTTSIKVSLCGAGTAHERITHKKVQLFVNVCMSLISRSTRHRYWIWIFHDFFSPSGCLRGWEGLFLSGILAEITDPLSWATPRYSDGD